jgi:hypothetical protein
MDAFQDDDRYEAVLFLPFPLPHTHSYTEILPRPGGEVVRDVVDQEGNALARFEGELCTKREMPLF